MPFPECKIPATGRNPSFEQSIVSYWIYPLWGPLLRDIVSIQHQRDGITLQIQFEASILPFSWRNAQLFLGSRDISPWLSDGVPNRRLQVYTFQKGQVKAANKRYDSAVAGGFIGCTSSQRYVDGMTQDSTCSTKIRQIRHDDTRIYNKYLLAASWKRRTFAVS